jgi:thiamine biosynthesis protein ThiS
VSNRHQDSTERFHVVSATVNGQLRECARGETLSGLIRELGLREDRLAIEMDRRIVRPADWPHTEIRDGAEIEIVQFVGGG